MMPRRTLLLIVGLAVATSILVYAAVIGTQPPPASQTQQLPTKTVIKNAEVYFDPEYAATSATSADIMINANKHKVTVVQLELAFDPQAVSSILINPPDNFSFFGDKLDYIELFKEVDYKNGKINYAIGISPTVDAKTGIGKVATLKYTLKNRAQTSTQIRFLGKTVVTEEGSRESVLKSTRPLTITSTQ